MSISGPDLEMSAQTGSHHDGLILFVSWGLFAAALSGDGATNSLQSPVQNVVAGPKVQLRQVQLKLGKTYYDQQHSCSTTAFSFVCSIAAGSADGSS